MNFGTSRVTSKGQLTIPQEIREKKGFTEGTSVIVIETDEGVLIKKSSDFKELFAPFRVIAKAEKLTRKQLAKEIADKKNRSLKRFLRLKP